MKYLKIVIKYHENRIKYHFDSGLNVVRTLSILLKAKEKGIIQEIKPLLDEMISKGRWYSKRVYRDFLTRINE